MGNKHTPPHHRGKHTRLAQQVTGAAYKVGGYRCPYCGLTLAEGIELWGEVAGAWDAAHINGGRVALGVEDYQAAHAHCNRSDGAKERNRRRSSRGIPPRGTTGYDWP